MGAGAEQVAADADVIADVEKPVEIEALVSHGIFFHVNLQALSALLQVGEAGFPQQADGHDASGDANVDSRPLQLLGGLVGIVRQNLRDGVGKVELVGIGSLSERFDLLELLAP